MIPAVPKICNTTSGTKLIDATGHTFVIKGINNPHAWFGEKAFKALDDIAETKANALRIVWQTKGREVIDGYNGIRSTAQRAKVFDVK